MRAPGSAPHASAMARGGTAGGERAAGGGAPNYPPPPSRLVFRVDGIVSLGPYVTLPQADNRDRARRHPTIFAQRALAGALLVSARVANEHRRIERASVPMAQS